MPEIPLKSRNKKGSPKWKDWWRWKFNEKNSDISFIPIKLKINGQLRRVKVKEHVLKLVKTLTKQDKNTILKLIPQTYKGIPQILREKHKKLLKESLWF